MKTLHAFILMLTACLLATFMLATTALADAKSSSAWGKVDYGKDRVYFPVSDGVMPAIANENLIKGIYYAAFFRKGENFNSYTNMIAAMAYPGVSKNPDDYPARTLLDLQVQDSRQGCPPDGLIVRFDPVVNGRNGMMTSCRKLKDGVPTLTYEYTVSFLGSDQVFVITHMAVMTGPNTPLEPPQKIIAAWKEQLMRTTLCARTVCTGPDQK